MHLPVLLDEVIHLLEPEPGDIILDGTLGGGGHAEAILEKIGEKGKLIAIDRDPEAIERNRARLGAYPNVTYVNGDFRNVDGILKENNITALDGALFDLGMSSFQVDDADRGFSFQKDGPLDMRFDSSRGVPAVEVVNSFGKEELSDIVREYGEERHAGLVAAAICAARKKEYIRTTGELTRIVGGALSRRYRRQKLHPAARTFQALRIYVNDELGAVEDVLGKTVPLMRAGARICVISFHSLEDRIVKVNFREMARLGSLELVTKKPLRPLEEEVRTNPRARSAKLRVAQRKHEAA